MWIFDRDLWNEIFTTLGKNMFRTFLTMLGVILAMLILILLLGSANGLSNGFNKIFEGTASNSLFVWSQRTSEPYKGFERGRRINFKIEDAEIIKREIPEIEVLAPRIELGSHRGVVTVYRNGLKSGSSVYGDYPEIDNITKKKLVEGRFLNQTDIEATFQKAYNSGDLMGWMAIAVEPGTQVPTVEAKIKKLLKNKYDISPKDERAIGSFDMSEIFNGISAFTTVLKGFSFFIGIFTLLAGVIAISNILLITVKERTKEIGVRRALGATPRIVKRQIVLEAIVIYLFITQWWV